MGVCSENKKIVKENTRRVLKQSVDGAMTTLAIYYTHSKRLLVGVCEYSCEVYFCSGVMEAKPSSIALSRLMRLDQSREIHAGLCQETAVALGLKWHAR